MRICPLRGARMRQAAAVLVLAFAVAAGCGGSTGPAGPQGTAGTAGSPGAKGASEAITFDLSCSSADSGSGTSLLFKYNYAQQASGGVIVSCSIVTAIQEYTSSQVYKTSVSDGNEGDCFLYFSIGGGSNFGYWHFLYSANLATVGYTDFSSTKNGYSFTFPSSSCSGP